MKSKIIAQALLKPENFLFASQQAGPYIDQPRPYSSSIGYGSTGEMRPILNGDKNDLINDFTYDGEVTKNSAGTTYIQDYRLLMFGDNWFRGSTITFTAGTYTGVTTITSFSQSGGTIFFSSIGVAPQSGDSYTITLPFNQQYLMFLSDSTTDGLDPGEESFTWSRSPAITSPYWFSRDNPNTAIWLGVSSIVQMMTPNHATVSPYLYVHLSSPACQAANGDLLIGYQYYNSLTTGTVFVLKSNNAGLSFYGTDTITTTSKVASPSEHTYAPCSMIRLQNNYTYKDRILFYLASTYDDDTALYLTPFYSDNNGASFKNSGITVPTISLEYITHSPRNIIELSDGRVFLTYNDPVAMGLNARYSYDGINFTEDVVLISGTTVDYTPSPCQSTSGRLFVFYRDTQAGYTTRSLSFVMSDDGGVSWRSGVSITTPTSCTGSLQSPHGYADINGDVYCFCEETISSSTKSHIVFFVSEDDGGTWSSKKVAVSELGQGFSCRQPYATLVDGHEVLLSYISVIGGGVTRCASKIARRGMWSQTAGTGYSYTAPNKIKQRLSNDIEVQWLGGNGYYLDAWTFGPKYRYAASNMISDSPNHVWRSNSDGVSCEIIIDMGATGALFVDSVAFFNCNFNTCSVELNFTDLWTSPYASKSISFNCASGELETSYSKVARANSINADYKSHELKDYLLRFTTGTSAGYTYRIIDNIYNPIVNNSIDTTNMLYIDTAGSQISISSGTSFVIFQKDIWADVTSITAGSYSNRYLRIYIPSQLTPEGYYQIGNFIAGKGVIFDNTWDWSNHSIDHDMNISFLQSLGGSNTPVEDGPKKRMFSMKWDKSENSYRQALSTINYCRGRNLALIPSTASTTEVYLAKQVGTIKQDFQYGNRWNLSVQFEESI